MHTCACARLPASIVRIRSFVHVRDALRGVTDVSATPAALSPLPHKKRPVLRAACSIVCSRATLTSRCPRIFWARLEILTPCLTEPVCRHAQATRAPQRLLLLGSRRRRAAARQRGGGAARPRACGPE